MPEGQEFKVRRDDEGGTHVPAVNVFIGLSWACGYQAAFYRALRKGCFVNMVLKLQHDLQI